MSACILLPTGVLPVNEITGTLGWVTIASPALGPVPNTILQTPAGRPEEINVAYKIQTLFFVN